jgi:cytochrome bd-type quinol oxidase subunit 1
MKQSVNTLLASVIVGCIVVIGVSYYKVSKAESKKVLRDASRDASGNI